ncbi:MAG: hypothetical protein QFX40_02060 [Archaeoglobales archaeon]|nr:hypothetical protein [Archaeoglobales archaeon]
MNLEDFCDFLKTLEELKYKSENGWLILVEGKKDAESLKLLGIGNVFVFSGLRDVAEKLEDKKVIVLTDDDYKGFIIECRLREILYDADFDIKKKLFSRIRKEVTKVEELYKFVQKYTEEFERKEFIFE